MSNRHQEPDLLDELLLGPHEPFPADEEQAEAQEEGSGDERRPRRRWWQRRRRPAPPDTPEVEDGQGSGEEPAPVVGEQAEESPAEQQGQRVAEVDAAPEDAEAEVAGDEAGSAGWRWGMSRRRTLLPEGFEPEAEGGESPSDEVVEDTFVSRRSRGRHLLNEDEADDSADGSDPSSLAGSGSVLPPSRGPRGTARARRRSRIRLLSVGGALLALAAAATLLAPSLEDNPSPQSTGSVASTDALADPVRTVLLYGISEDQATRASWMTLLSLNSETREGSVVYIPAHTATEVPGRGLLAIGESLGSGPSLLEVSTETLLGVPVDDRLQLTPEGAAAVFQGVGDVSVDVPSEVRVTAGERQARLLIPQGLQQLAPAQLVSLLFRPGIEVDDAELGSRHLALWDGVMTQYADDSVALGNAVAQAEPPVGAPAATERIGAFLSDLAELPTSSRTLANLPVNEVSVGGDELYQTDPDELSAFVGETVGETDLAADLSRVQVLNGNGVPGIGIDVAEKLVGNGYQITLSGNAERLDYYRTHIVSYDPSPEGIAAARRARELLGAGTVQVSSQGQGIVDLTIVVGRDFLRTR